NEAQSGAWCPRFRGEHARGFEVEAVAGRNSPAATLRVSIPSVLTRGLTHRPASALIGVGNRPSPEPRRACTSSILLTTHFSGADEASASDGASQLIRAVMSANTQTWPVRNT